MNKALRASLQNEIDKRWMHAAIAQSRLAEGRTASNPPVGCVIINKDGELASAAHTGANGIPHAEIQAIKNAGKFTVGGTAYVTLEPCAHHGKTPPCIEALINASIARLVVSVIDPDPRVNGRGLKEAKSAGIDVKVGVEADKAIVILDGFLNRIRYGRPYVWLKTASSLDGAIALYDGKKRWLTSDLTRYFVHELRSRCDALMTGVGTVIADDPAFTCRKPSLLSDSPMVFILDSKLRTPKSAKILNNGQSKVNILCTSVAPKKHVDMFCKAGIEITILPSTSCGRVDLQAALEHLGSSGINRVLFEAGTGVTTSILEDALADKIFWTQSGHILGGDALPVVGDLKLVTLPKQSIYTQIDSSIIGSDQLRIFKKNINENKSK